MSVEAAQVLADGLRIFGEQIALGMVFHASISGFLRLLSK